MGSVRAGGPYKIPYDPLANNPGLQAMEAYRTAKANRRAQEREDAAYAAQIAEMQGEYTPELERRVLAPLGEEAGLGDQVVGGLRRLFGSDTTQGMTRPYTSPTGLQTKYQRELDTEQRKNALSLALEEAKQQANRTLKEYEAAEAMKRAEFNAAKNIEGRKLTAEENRKLQDVRDAAALKRTNIREAGANKRKGMGGGVAKVGSTLEDIRQKIAQGKQLTKGEQQLYNDSITGKKPQRDYTSQARTITQKMIDDGMVEMPDNEDEYEDKYWELFDSNLRKLQEDEGSEPAPKDNRQSLDEIFK